MAAEALGGRRVGFVGCVWQVSPLGISAVELCSLVASVTRVSASAPGELSVPPPWPFRRDGGLGTLEAAHGLQSAVAGRDALRIVGLGLLCTLGDRASGERRRGPRKVGVVGTQLLPSPHGGRKEKKARMAPPCDDALAVA